MTNFMVGFAVGGGLFLVADVAVTYLYLRRMGLDLSEMQNLVRNSINRLR